MEGARHIAALVSEVSCPTSRRWCYPLVRSETLAMQLPLTDHFDEFGGGYLFAAWSGVRNGFFGAWVRVRCSFGLTHLSSERTQSNGVFATRSCPLPLEHCTRYLFLLHTIHVGVSLHCVLEPCWYHYF